MHHSLSSETFTELREHPCIGVHWAQQHVLIILSSRCCPSDGTHDMATTAAQAATCHDWVCVQRINDGTHSVATNGKENTRKLVYHMWGSILKSAIDVLYYYLIFLKLELSFKPNSSKKSVKFIVELIHGGVGETMSWNRLVPNTPLGRLQWLAISVARFTLFPAWIKNMEKNENN